MAKSPFAAHTRLMGISISLGGGATFFNGALFALVLVIIAALTWEKFRDPLNIFTGVLALATLALVYVSALQWRTLEKTDETARASERAFVFPAPKKAEWRPAVKNKDVVTREFPVVWENSGNSPTVNLVIETYCHNPVPLSEENPITQNIDPTVRVQRLVGPKQTTWGGACIYNADQLYLVKNSGYHLYIGSTADYSDIFDKHHHTESCTEIVGLSKADKFEDVNVIPGGSLINCGRNCADKECEKP
jgi:hypothetical protein